MWHIRKRLRYLEESTGIVLFEDFQAVLHHASCLTELHGAVGDLVAHHLITDHTSDCYMFIAGPFSSCGGKSFPETAWLEPTGFPPLQSQILSASPALRRWREIRFWWMSQQFAGGLIETRWNVTIFFSLLFAQFLHRRSTGRSYFTVCSMPMCGTRGETKECSGGDGDACTCFIVPWSNGYLNDLEKLMRRFR